jgi:hypothetical protein
MVAPKKRYVLRAIVLSAVVIGVSPLAAHVSTGRAAQEANVATPTGDPLMTTTDQVVVVGNAALASVFGGAAIDRSSGTVQVLLTDLAPSNQELLKAAVKHPELLRFSLTNYTQAQLFALRDRVWGDRSTLLSHGVHVWGAGIGFGTVVISISNTDAQAVAYLKQRYGEAVRVSVGPEPTFQSGPTQTRLGPPPYMGGMEIDNVGNYQTVTSGGYYYECTAGFVAASQYTYEGIRFFYLLTAGHCFGASIAQEVYHAVATQQTDTPIGRVIINSFYGGGKADAESISIDGGYQLASNQVITAEPYVHTVDYVAGTQESIYNQSVCKSGMHTDQTCAFTVTAIHNTVTSVDPYTGVETTLQDQVTACCDAVEAGDSGGPVYHYYQPQAIYGAGLVSSANNIGQMDFSFIQDIRSDLDVNICTQTPQPFGC